MCIAANIKHNTWWYNSYTVCSCAVLIDFYVDISRPPSKCQGFLDGTIHHVCRIKTKEKRKNTDNINQGLNMTEHW